MLKEIYENLTPLNGRFEAVEGRFSHRLAPNSTSKSSGRSLAEGSGADPGRSAISGDLERPREA